MVVWMALFFHCSLFSTESISRRSTTLRHHWGSFLSGSIVAGNGCLDESLDGGSALSGCLKWRRLQVCVYGLERPKFWLWNSWRNSECGAITTVVDAAAATTIIWLTLRSCPKSVFIDIVFTERFHMSSTFHLHYTFNPMLYHVTLHSHEII